MRKTMWMGMCLLGILTVSAPEALAYGATVADLERRLAGATGVLSEVMAAPDQSIPEELLAKCKAIAIYPGVVKGGFIFGVRFGKGVVVTKDKKNGVFGPVAFSTIGGGSFGLQAGGQATDLILVIMNNKGLDALLSNNLTLGGNISVAAGPVGRHSEAATDLSLHAGIISYSRSRGLFAGASLEGALVTQDNRSNSTYYGKSVGSKEILLDRKVSVQPSSKPLVDALNEFSGHWEKRVGLKA